MTNPILVEVTRGPVVESRHRGAIVVVDARGKRRAAIGDVDQPVYPRSAVKLLQALPLVESGAADACGYGAAELALACASHNGEPRHVATATAMLSRCGRSADNLECGAHMPMDSTAARTLIRAGTTATAIHNNCSGKHAGFICLACHLGIDPRGYVEPDHAVQREVTAALAETTGAVLGAENRAVDGCSIPTYAIPLDRLALAFARVVTGEGLPPARAAAARRLAEACMTEPWFVAGTGRFCTDVMAMFAGRLLVKTGAEGVYCAAIPELGLGVALKCEDGTTRAAEVMKATAIASLLPMSEPERAAFADRLTPAVENRKGRKVGEIRPVAGLVEAIRQGRSV